MKICTIGNGFVSDHLSYHKINERITTDLNQINSLLDREKPDVLVNCIGKTGRPNIDWCESHKEETALANTTIPILLAEACQKKSIHLIQIGSGCIFYGKSPNGDILEWKTPYVDHLGRNKEKSNFSLSDTGWKEEDAANPQSFYSKTKYACDIVLGNMKDVTTLRIRMPISTKNNERNLINKLRGYIQVIDIPNSMTFMDDLVRCVAWAAQDNHTGIFHVTNPEPITAVQIMHEYQKYIPEHTFETITEFQLDRLTLAKRSNCILDSSKLKNAGFIMTSSKEALQKCMIQYVENI